MNSDDMADSLMDTAALAALQKEAGDLADRTGLSLREAEVRILKDDGLTHEDISDRLGIAKGTVDSLSSRANSKIREALELRGYAVEHGDTVPSCDVDGCHMPGDNRIHGVEFDGLEFDVRVCDSHSREMGK